MSHTGIVAALTAEARALGAINTDGTGRLFMISGMGPQAAARAAQALVAAGAEGLLSFGFAGALDPSLRAGTIVVPQTLTDGAGRVHTAYGPWREWLAAQAGTLREAPAVTGGTLLSVAQPLTSMQSKSQAWTRSAACAVDMESFAIADVAVQTGISFAVARVVIDGATDALPQSVIRATGAYGDVNLSRLLVGLISAPGDLAALLRLPGRYRAAVSSLRALGNVDLGLP